MERPTQQKNQKHSALVRTSRESARAASLRYQMDSRPGIRRFKKGHGFSYSFEEAVIRDKDTLDRIRQLAIPPAWRDVWICADPRGHLQATGWDEAGRKQYRYHPLWAAKRSERKFKSLYNFGKKLPAIRQQVSKDLLSKQLTERKVIATVIRLMEETCIRIGNEEYEKKYGSYGLSTLKDNHVNVKSGRMTFAFKGKKGKFRKVTLQNKKLATAVKRCRDIPGKELFQYYDSDGSHHPIDSGMVNEYIREISGDAFSAKDFRTWAGTVSMLQALVECGPPENKTQARKNIIIALDAVSEKLGNTRAVCRNYYVHPAIITSYEKGELLEKYQRYHQSPNGKNGLGLSVDENIVVKIIKDEHG